MLATSNTGKIGRGFNWKNAGEWTGRVEIGKEEISGSKRSMYGYTLTYSRLYTEKRLSSVFSPDGTLISASAAPHCGASQRRVRLGSAQLGVHHETSFVRASNVTDIIKQCNDVPLAAKERRKKNKY